MGFLSSLLGIIGFGIGIPVGLLVGYFLFIYFKPIHIIIKDPVIRSLHELDSDAFYELLPEIPLWVKSPDYDRVDWLNQFIFDMWPYLDKETIKKKVVGLYLWPRILEIPILDGSIGVLKGPVGILHVRVIRAIDLLKMDFLGKSDPYVKLSLSCKRLPAKKTKVKRKDLNPEWNEVFKLIVEDPESQVLQLHVYDWEKVGMHGKLGMQEIPLRSLVPHEAKEFTLDLLKNTNSNDPQNKKQRGKIMVELTFNPFKEDTDTFTGPMSGNGRKESRVGVVSADADLSGAGLLSVMVQGAEDVDGRHHNNPYALIIFKGEQKKTKMMKKTRDPRWNEEFQFMLEAAPLDEKLLIEVISKRTWLGFRKKEALGYIDINLTDVVNNGRINEKYHLINSKNGMIHVEIRWNTI